MPKTPAGLWKTTETVEVQPNAAVLGHLQVRFEGGGEGLQAFSSDSFTLGVTERCRPVQLCMFYEYADLESEAPGWITRIGSSSQPTMLTESSIAKATWL